MDFRKAFDYLNRDFLWFKLLKSGIRGNMYDIIKHKYKETTASVKHQGILSDIHLYVISEYVKVKVFHRFSLTYS